MKKNELVSCIAEAFGLEAGAIKILKKQYSPVARVHMEYDSTYFEVQLREGMTLDEFKKEANESYIQETISIVKTKQRELSSYLRRLRNNNISNKPFK